MARTLRPSRVIASDLVPAAVVAAIWEWNVFGTGGHLGTHVAGPRALAAASGVLVAVPLAFRRRQPLLACALVMAGIVAQAAASGRSPEGLQIIALWVLAPYSVAAYGRRREALVGLGLTLAAFAVYSVQNDDITSGRQSDQWAGAFFLILAVGAWLAGMAVRGRREAVALSAHATALAAEARLASTEERSRIARELHDIVAHNLSVVVVQAAGARAQGEARPADPTTLEKIERSGREALVEMRRLVGVLREDDGGGGELSPHPGLAQLPALVERIRAAGLTVDVMLEGDCSTLPPAVDLSAYRIVQEALTNTVRHAGPEALVRVALDRTRDALTIAVVDDGGRRPRTTPADVGGHGLIGMRERVAVFGGELDASPTADGGFAVRARLPVPNLAGS